MRRAKLQECFSAEDIDSRPNEGQVEILKAVADVLIRVVRAGNQSGKTATAARDLTWILNRTHPYINVTETWGTGALQIIVAGQDRSVIEHNIWSKHIKPLLTNPEDWREIRPSGSLTSAVNKKTGDMIIFMSHNNSSEDDIKHMQGYSAHYVWVDEMPKSPRVFEELTRRIDAKRGRLIITFTQKVRNDAIRKSVDNLDPLTSRLFRLSKLQNPIYADRLAEELAKISHLTKEEQDAILFGDWIESSSRVYSFDRDAVVATPKGYDHSWPHVLMVDPATESKLGAVVMACDIATGVWWCVQAFYVEGVYVPTKIIQAVEDRVKNLNVIRRGFDTAASWYAHQAREMGYTYLPVEEKANSKQNWIAELQQKLGSTLMFAPWATAPLDEMETCERSPSDPTKIMNKSKYHLCVTEDTQIWTSTGPKPVAEIKVGDLVWTHRGRLRSVTKTWDMPGDRPLHELQVHSRYPLKITDNHPLFTAEFTRTNSKEQGLTGQLRHTGSYEWTPAGDITPEVANTLVRQVPWCPNLVCEEGEAWSPLYFTYGYYTAEGSCSQSSGQLSFAGHQKETGVLPILRSVFAGKTVSLFNSPTSMGRSITVSSTKDTHLFAKFGKGKDKCLPEELFPKTKKEAIAFIQGWVYGDGHFNKQGNQCIGSTVSRKLAFQLQQIGALAGILVTIRFLKRAGRWAGFGARGLIPSDSYSVSISNSSLDYLRESIRANCPFVAEEKLNFDCVAVEGKVARRDWPTEEGVALKLKSNKQVAQVDRVYTLSVDEDNSYIANGVAVKNCDSLHYFLALCPRIEVPKTYSSWHHWLLEKNRERKVTAKLEQEKKTRQRERFRVQRRPGLKSWR